MPKNMPQEIVDVYAVTLSVEEGETGRLLIKGPFGHCEQATSNGRLYPRKIMESNFNSLQGPMSKRRLFGELDHPADGKTSLKRVSHIVTELSINEDGEVFGALEPLPTPMGNILKALAKAGCEIGVSSRGRGSIVSRNGVDEVQEDFVLKTYDVVDNPASKNAFPTISESAQVEAFLESVPEGHRDDVRVAFTEAASKIDTFTLEDIKDEALRARVSEALGMNEAGLNEASLEEVALTGREPEDLAFVVDTAIALGDVQAKKFLKKVIAANKVMPTPFRKALIAALKAKVKDPDEESADTEEADLAELTALRECKCEVLKLLKLPDDSLPAKVLESVTELSAERNRLHESLTSKLPELRAELREDVSATVRAELLADPKVAGSKMVLENIISLLAPYQVLGAENQSDRLRRENVALADALQAKEFDLATTRMEAAQTTKEANAKLMEAKLSELIVGHPKAESIRKLIGPLSRLEGMDELTSRVEVAFESMGRPDTFASEAAIDATAKITALTAKVATLESAAASKGAKLNEAAEIGESLNEEVDALKKKLEAALKAAELAEVQAYAAKKVVGRPDAVQALALCEDATTRAAVDRVLTRTRAPAAGDDEVPMPRVRSRVAAAAQESLQESARPTGRAAGGRAIDMGNNFAIDLDEAAALAGQR